MTREHSSQFILSTTDLYRRYYVCMFVTHLFIGCVPKQLSFADRTHSDTIRCEILGSTDVGVLAAQGPLPKIELYPLYINKRGFSFRVPIQDQAIGYYQIVGPRIAPISVRVSNTSKHGLVCAEPVAFVVFDALVRGKVSDTIGLPTWVEGCGLNAPGSSSWSPDPGLKVDPYLFNEDGESTYVARVARGVCTLKVCHQNGAIRVCGAQVDVDTTEMGFAVADLALPRGIPGGVGLDIRAARIEWVAPGRAADRAGIVVNSRVVAIDGHPIDTDVADEQITEQIVGPIGTEVALSIVDSHGVTREYALVREAIPAR